MAVPGPHANQLLMKIILNMFDNFIVNAYFKTFCAWPGSKPPLLVD